VEEEKKTIDEIKSDIGELFIKLFDPEQIKATQERTRKMELLLSQGKTLRETLEAVNINPVELGIDDIIDKDISEYVDIDGLKEQFNFNKEDLKKTEDAQKLSAYLVKRIVVEGALPRDALNISDEIMNTFYAQGYALYNGAKFDEAEVVFRLLKMLNPIEERYLFALAAAQHKNKKYQEAIVNYLVSATLNLDNALSLYHTVDCCLKRSDPESALVFISMIKKIYSSQNKWKDLIEKVVLMEKIINKKIGSLPEEERPPMKDFLPVSGPLLRIIDKARMKYNID